MQVKHSSKAKKCVYVDCEYEEIISLEYEKHVNSHEKAVDERICTNNQSTEREEEMCDKCRKNIS